MIMPLLVHGIDTKRSPSESVTLFSDTNGGSTTSAITQDQWGLTIQTGFLVQSIDVSQRKKRTNA